MHKTLGCDDVVFLFVIMVRKMSVSVSIVIALKKKAKEIERGRVVSSTIVFCEMVQSVVQIMTKKLQTFGVNIAKWWRCNDFTNSNDFLPMKCI